MFDRKLVDLYQWIVDTSEKKPTWLATQAMMCSASFDIVATVVNWHGGWSAVWVFFVMAIAAMLINTTRSEVTFRANGETPLRQLFLGIAIVNFGIALGNFTGINVLHTISNVAFMSFYYFASCENPRPKKRKEKLVLHEA